MGVERFTNSMQQKDWHGIFSEDCNMDSAYDEFIETIKVGIYECEPRITKRNSKKTPWMTKLTWKPANKKRAKNDKYKFLKTAEDYATYGASLNAFTAEKNTTIKMYENNVITFKNSNPKKFSNYVYRKRKYKDTKIILKDSDELCDDEERCACILIDYFGSAFTTEASQIPVQVSGNYYFSTMHEIAFNPEDINKN